MADFAGQGDWGRQGSWGTFGNHPDFHAVARASSRGTPWVGRLEAGLRPPESIPRPDPLLREEIDERFEDRAHLDPMQIEVEVIGGVVKLSGTVADERASHLAEEIAASAAGVEEVENNLRVTGSR